MEKKQSSVDWLANRIDEIIELYPSQRQPICDAIKQAKAMHREEHLETWVESAVQHRKENHYRKKKILLFEDYYNETFHPDQVDGEEP